MISVHVTLVLSSAAIVAVARRGVTFVQKAAVDPCEDKVLVFATLGSVGSQVRHAFRMRGTDVLFTLHDTSRVPFWSATKGLDLSLEISFFHRQMEMVSGIGALLGRSKPVHPVYEFDSASGVYMFQLYLADRLACMYAGDRVTYYPGYHDLVASVKTEVDRYNRGVGVDLLQAEAKTLGLRWRNFCTFLQALENNATDEYTLRYDREQGNLECFVQSKTPWRHLVLFGQTPATRTSRYRNERIERYVTVGYRRHDRRRSAVCNITSPNGMIALQTFEAEVPTTTTALRTSETTAFFSTPAPDKEETSDDSSASGTGAATIAVPFVLVFATVLGGGVGLFVFRERVARFATGFCRTSTGDR